MITSGFVLSPATAREWLLDQGLCESAEPVEISELAGGVSGTVLRADLPGRRIVLKQPLKQLKVQSAWEIEETRVLFERDFMLLMGELGLGASVPALLACDEAAHVLAMTHADASARGWKDDLMLGMAPAVVAHRAGQLLAELQNSTWRRQVFLERFDHAWVFEQGRIGPFFITATQAHPDLATHLDALLKELHAAPTVVVHGDYSPKNMLYMPAGDLLLLDHEIAHAGHFAFDPACCLTHLCMKLVCFPQVRLATWRAAVGFQQAYLSRLEQGGERIEQEITRQMGWLLLARIDGKSQIEYASPVEREWLREAARRIILRPATTILELLEDIRGRLGSADTGVGLHD